MKFRSVVKTIGIVGVSLALTGCGSGTEISRLNNIQSLNTESDENDYNLTLSEKQSMVYAEVSDRTLLDLSILEDCSDTELQQVVTYMDSVDAQLAGQVKARDGVINACFTDYLLAEFEKTPYYWQRTQTTVRGIDSSSRSIVVDVDYSTIGFEKTKQDDSYITAGEDNYDKKVYVRYTRWMNILGDKYAGHDNNWVAEFNRFKKIYGDPQKIFESQRNTTLTDEVFETGNQKTYSGLIDSGAEKQSASMTVRFVLVPKYAMGVNLGLDCKHMYVVDYAIGEDPTEGLDLFKEDGYTTVSDNVFKLVDSYFKCIDESDVRGLYKNTYKFNKLDKYYLDMFETTYSKHDNYSVSLFDIKGTKIVCGVQVASKIRAKGSNMTMPVYTDRYYMELQLVDDKLQVTNMVLLSRRLEGEPAINTDDADDTGFVASIDLNNASRQQIEKLICDFSSLQLLKDDKSDKFMGIVDYSMSENKLAYLRENMKSLGGKKKVVWLQTYQNGTSNYASVKCKEQYQKEDNSIIDATVTYEFISKGAKWYIYGYDVLSSTTLDTTNLTTSNSLCTVTAGKTESYTSQVASTEGEGDTEKIDEIKDGVVYSHKMHIPKLKSGKGEVGLLKMTIKMMADKQCDSYLKERSKDTTVTIEALKAADKEAGLSSSKSDSSTYLAKRIACVIYNRDNNRISSNDYKDEVSAIKADATKNSSKWGDSDAVKEFISICNSLN